MHVFFDHLLAVVCGGALIVGALTLQARGSASAMESAVSDVARGRAVDVIDELVQEFDNVMSQEQAAREIGAYRSRLERDGSDERTTLVETPVFVRTSASGPPVAAHVLYRLVPTGSSVEVGDGSRETFRLTRAVDTGAGYGAGSVVATDLVDFDVIFRGRADEVTSGAPPIRFSHVAMAATVAVSGGLSGAAPEARSNAARVGIVVRPPNLSSGS